MRTLILLALIAALASCAGPPPSAPRAADSAVIPPSLIPPGYVAADCHLVQPGKEDVQRSKDLNFECTKQTVTNTSRPAGNAPSDAESAPQTQEHDPNWHPVDGCHVTHDHDPNTPDASPVAHVRCTTRTEYGPRMTKTAKCRSPGGKELPPEEYCCSTPAGDPIPHCTPKPIPSGE